MIEQFKIRIQFYIRIKTCSLNIPGIVLRQGYVVIFKDPLLVFFHVRDSGTVFNGIGQPHESQIVKFQSGSAQNDFLVVTPMPLASLADPEIHPGSVQPCACGIVRQPASRSLEIPCRGGLQPAYSLLITANMAPDGLEFHKILSVRPILCKIDTYT